MAENAEMAVVSGDAIEVPGLHAPALGLARFAELGSFAGVVLLALALNTWHLARNGYGNTYYAAAVRSMTASWSNFFFGAFDPGGFITVDKPPAFLWVGALSARVFGYSSWSILLPSAVAGAATVGLLWLIVRRYFGPLAATIAGAALALTPITVAVSRLNLPEPFLILALLGAAGAILVSLESRRWWAWTLLAGFLVGVAFNTKMLAAWIPGPALALAVVAAYPDVRKAVTLRRVGLQLAVLLVSTLVVSGSWMLIVDHWPGDRPYVGGSKDNTVQNLVLDYNGVGRVEGNERPGPGGTPAGNFTRPATNRGGAPFQPGGINTNRPPAGPGGGINGPGGIIAGTPGLWRMFDASNGPQIAWLLPAALLGACLALAAWWRDRRARAAIVLMAGWVLSFGLVFSYAKGIYHSYYTSAMAPGVAALLGITVAAAISLARRDRRWLVAFLPVAVATLWVQFDLAGRFPDHQAAARPIAIFAVAAGIALAAALALRRTRLGLAPGVAAVAAGLLVMPSAWSFYEATHTSINTTLPQAGPREGAAGRSFGSSAFDGGVPALATWLESHRDTSTRWDLVTASAQNASTLIAGYDLSVMALGGFSGSDPTLSVAGFADLVSKGEVRYVLASQGGFGGFGGGRNFTDGTRPGNGGTGQNVAPNGTSRPGFDGAQRGTANPGAPPAAGGPQIIGAPVGGTVTNGANAVMTAVRSACTPVSGTDAPSGYSGSLYDCAGAADRLKSLTG